MGNLKTSLLETRTGVDSLHQGEARVETKSWQPQSLAEEPRKDEPTVQSPAAAATSERQSRLARLRAVCQAAIDGVQAMDPHAEQRRNFRQQQTSRETKELRVCGANAPQPFLTVFSTKAPAIMENIPIQPVGIERSFHALDGLTSTQGQRNWRC